MRLLGFLGLMVVSLALFGDETIQNGKTPKGKAYKIEFTEDLKLGGSDDEKFRWDGPNVAVQTDAKGHIFVVDPKECRIIEYDTKGGFVKTIGTRGQGPGEFMQLSSFQILGDGSAVAFEALGPVTNTTFYDKDLKYVDRKTSNDLQRVTQGMQYSPNGELVYAVFVSVKPPMMENHFVVFDKDMKNIIVPVSTSEQMAFNPQRMGDTEFWVEFLSEAFEAVLSGLGVVGFDQNSNMYTGISTKYEITRWSADGKKKLGVITKEYKPKPFTEEVIQDLVSPIHEQILGNLPPQIASIVTENVVQRAMDKAEFPATKAPLNGISFLEDGHFFVIHDQDLAARRSDLDLFNPKGEFIGSFVVENNAATRMIFENGLAYAIETRDDDENYMVRYRYKVVPQ